MQWTLADEQGVRRLPHVAARRNGHIMARRLVAAGKNFASFDRQFLNRLDWRFKKLFHHRSLDPGSMFVNSSSDSVPPSTEECGNRASLKRRTKRSSRRVGGCSLTSFVSCEPAVMGRKAQVKLMFRIGDAIKTRLPPRSVDLVLGSPPYTNRRTYIDASNASRYASEGNGVGAVDDGRDPRRTSHLSRAGHVGCEWLCRGWEVSAGCRGTDLEAYKAGIKCEHPLIWSKNAAPNRKDWWCNAWEFIVACDPDRLGITTSIGEPLRPLRYVRPDGGGVSPAKW
jgi:hypothetical protein